jgi:hypothetical protein
MQIARNFVNLSKFSLVFPCVSETAQRTREEKKLNLAVVKDEQQFRDKFDEGIRELGTNECVKTGRGKEGA